MLPGVHAYFSDASISKENKGLKQYKKYGTDDTLFCQLWSYEKHKTCHSQLGNSQATKQPTDVQDVHYVREMCTMCRMCTMYMRCARCARLSDIGALTAAANLHQKTWEKNIFA